MVSTLDRKKTVQETGKNRYGFILAFIFMVWLFWPHNNSFIRLSYWSYDLLYNVSKLFNIPITDEAMYNRNCAVYLAKIYPKNPEKSLKTMSKAIAVASKNKAEIELENFYKDLAIIKLYYGDKAGALESFEKVNETIEDPIDNIRAAILLAEEKRYEDAISYCKNILVTGKDKSSLGYVCMAYVYEKTGEPEAALNVYDWIIARSSREAYLYVERANLEKRMGDIEAYQKDINTVKKINPDVDIESIAVIDNALNFKKFPLSIK